MRADVSASRSIAAARISGESFAGSPAPATILEVLGQLPQRETSSVGLETSRHPSTTPKKRAGRARQRLQWL